MYLIFDLDQTLVNTSVAEAARKSRNWSEVNRLIPQMAIYDGIADILAHVHQNKTSVAIVTSSPKNYCENVIRYHGINVPIIIGYHDTVRHKPDPAPIRAALTRFGNPPPNEVYSFGDTVGDIIASQQAGVHSVACLWGSSDPEGLKAAHPEFSFNSPQEVIAFLERLRA